MSFIDGNDDVGGNELTPGDHVDSGEIWLHDLDVCGFIIGLVLLNEPGDVESEPADDGVAVMNFLAAKGVA